MAGPSSTTLVLVGANAGRALVGLSHLQNVRIASFPDDSDGDVETWISRSNTPYAVHDRDPLGHVASAWVEFFDDLVSLGTLDLEVDRAVAALEGGRLSLPDYYIVVDPQSLAPTWKHWWLGVLPQAAPTRVIPWDDGSIPLARILRRLPVGRPWPEPNRWLREVARAVPDRVGLEGRED